jgi:ubiquinone/menaquinone biosynthesis C-methylase UbiE
MTGTNTSFGGMIPESYNHGLGPMFFEPYARDLARRAQVGSGAAVLEVAAGTGIVTRELLRALPSDARLTVTDISEAMLALARTGVADDPRASCQTADAMALPFGESAFDLVVNQFGLMFPSDKGAVLREARRVLKPSGTLLFNVWASLTDNPIARIAHETIGSFFPLDPPRFYEIPFGLYDRTLIERMLQEARFKSVGCDVVDGIGEHDSAESAANGLVFGSPVLTGILERNGDATAIMRAVAERLAREGGERPMQLPMRALVFEART